MERVKEERALIQRRTVEPASTEVARSSGDLYECVISAPPASDASLSQRVRNGKIARLPKLERDPSLGDILRAAKEGALQAK